MKRHKANSLENIAWCELGKQKGLFGENFMACYSWKLLAKDVCFDRFLPRLAASSLEKILDESGIHIDKAAIEQEQQENSDFTCKSSSNHFQTHLRIFFHLRQVEQMTLSHSAS